MALPGRTPPPSLRRTVYIDSLHQSKGVTSGSFCDAIIMCR